MAVYTYAPCRACGGPRDAADAMSGGDRRLMSPARLVELMRNAA